MVLVGPSGCGKTTALRMVAGLEEISDGEIRIGERVVNDVPPRERDVAMVFQNYALYPHKTVYENLAFPLKLRRLAKADIDQRVKRIARLLELDEQLKRRPRQLSGGQRQRVAMGRAIVREPQAFLMDEPLSNLDAKLRTQMRAEIGLLHKELARDDDLRHARPGRGDDARQARGRHAEGRAAAGRLRPQELYDRPVEHLRRRLHRQPRDELRRGTVVRETAATRSPFGEQRLLVDDAELAAAPGPRRAGRAGRSSSACGPEHLQDAALSRGVSEERRLDGQVRLRESLGAEVIVHFQVEAAPVVPTRCVSWPQDVDDDCGWTSWSTAARAAHRLRRALRRRRPAWPRAPRREIAVAPGALRLLRRADRSGV